MPTLTRPGVYVSTSSFPTYVSSSPGTASACFVGVCPRGPVIPTRVNSWREFTNLFGGFETAYPPSLLHLAVYTFFSAGGSSAMIIRSYRTDASGPTLATTTVNDQATTAVPTLQINADNVGAWGNNLWVNIIPGTQKDSLGSITSFTIQVMYKGSAPANVVETWPDLSMSPGSAVLGVNNYAINIVNNPYTGSNYISLTDKAATSANPRSVVDGVTTSASPNFTSATAAFVASDKGGTLSGPGIPTGTLISTVTSATAVVMSNNATATGSSVHVTITPPAYIDNPVTNLGPINLSGGGDGSPITFQDQLAALQLLDQYPDQPFVINMPGLTAGSDITGVVGYAQQRGDSFVVIDCPPAMSPASMVTFVQGLSASSQCAIYYPQVQISDPYSSVPGVTRMVGPGGFVAGMYIATDANRGVQKAPAGLGATLLGAYGLERTLTNADQGSLTQANVNCLISVPGSGVVIWGARTLSPYLVTRYVPVERTLLYLQTELAAMTKFAVFEPNDWVLWNSITMILSQFLTSFWQSGGLQGTNAASAYYVTCDESNNTPQTIQQGIVNVEVGVALQYPAEFVVIQIGQWAGGQSVSVTTV